MMETIYVNENIICCMGHFTAFSHFTLLICQVFIIMGMTEPLKKKRILNKILCQNFMFEDLQISPYSQS